MATSPDISQLQAYAGDYEKQLFSKLFNSLDAFNDVTVYPDVKVAVNMTKLRAGDGARPYNSDFEARGTDLIYTGRKLSPDEGKRDIKVIPSKYRPTWMSLVMQPGHNPLDIPFASYVWNQVMVELGAEINDKTIYFGFDKTTATVFSGAATYAVGDYITLAAADGIIDYWKCISATTAGQSPVTNPAKWQKVNAEAITIGFAARIAAAITAGDLSPVTLGTIDATHAYDQFTTLFRSMPIPYQKAGVKIYSSWSNRYFLYDDFETKVGKYTETDPVTGNIYLAKTDKKCQIIGATWMTGSNRLICTPKENLLIGTDRVSDLNKINTEPHLRSLDAGIDFSLGTQIRDLEAIKVSEAA